MDEEFDIPQVPTRPQRDTRLLDPDTGEPYVGNGRPYGAIDIVDGDVRAHVHAAMKHLDGGRYFVALARSHVPSDRTAFIGLVARCMPTELKGDLKVGFSVELVNYAAQAKLDAQRANTIDMEPTRPPQPVHSALLD